MSEKHKMIHKARLAQNILLSMNKERQWVKNSVQNKIWTLWIHCHAVWTEKCIDYLSTTDQQHNTRISECLCDHVSKWYSDIFWHAERTSETCVKNVEKTWWMNFVCQQKKELIWSTESMLLKICHMTEQDHSESTKNKSNYELTEIHETEKNAGFLESGKLLLMICCIALSCSEIFDMSYT